MLVDVTWSKSINKLENFIKVNFLSSKRCNLSVSSIGPINNIQPSYRQIIAAKKMMKAYLATGQIRYKPFLLNSLKKTLILRCFSFEQQLEIRIKPCNLLFLRNRLILCILWFVFQTWILCNRYLFWDDLCKDHCTCFYTNYKTTFECHFWNATIELSKCITLIILYTLFDCNEKRLKNK